MYCGIITTWNGSIMDNSMQANQNPLNLKLILAKPYPITASIGVVARERTDELDVEQMIGKADTLMYSNKRKAKENRS